MKIQLLKNMIAQEIELSTQTIRHLDRHSIDPYSFNVGYRNALRLLAYELNEGKY
jgi:hypothetical protein